MADIVNNVSLWLTHPRPHAEVMNITYPLHTRFTALDAVGTFQVLATATGMQSTQ